MSEGNVAQESFDSSTAPIGVVAAQEAVSSDTQQNQPTPTTSEDFSSLLSDEYKAHPSAVKFKDVNGFFKSYTEMESFRGKQGIIKPDPNNPDDVARFYNELGVPEAPDKYEMAEPEQWAKELGYNQDVLRSIAHQAHLTLEQAQAVEQVYLTDIKQTVAQQQQQKKEALGQAQQALRSEFGEKYDEKIAMASKVAENFGGNEEFASKVKEQINVDPAFAKMMIEIGSNFAEHRIGDFESMNNSMSSDAAQTKINEVMSADRKTHAYWNDKDPVAHVQAVAQMDEWTRMAIRKR